MTVTWRGVFPAVCTQFHADQSLDVPGTLAHLDAMLEAGVHGLIMLGTVGENCSLEPAEKLDVLKATVDHVGRRVPVLTGVAEYTTGQACRFAADAAKLGADGLMVLPAMVYKSDPRETVAHFRTVARATDLPIMVYNNPPSYGVDITPRDVRRPGRRAEVRRHQGVVGERPADHRPHERCRRPLRPVLRRGRPGAGEPAARGGRLGVRAGQRLPGREPAAVGPGHGRASGRRRWRSTAGTRRCLHLDTHPKLVQYIKLAAQECGYGTRD